MLAASTLRSLQRLQRNVDEAAIPAAGVGVHVIDGWIRLDDVHQLQDGIVHQRERSILRTLHAADDRSRVLLREEALGHLDDQHHVQCDDQHKNGEHEAGIVEHPVESIAVSAQNPVESTFAERGKDVRAFRSSRAFSRCAHIMGVVVSEMTIETRMAVDRVTANSRKRRPTMPPIIRMGMKTAISEMLMEKTVKPISLAPSSAASIWLHALFQVARDVFHHHDGVIDDKAGRDGQRHERKIVEAVTAQVHHRERADERDRDGDARNHGRAHISQEEKHHQHHQDRRRRTSERSTSLRLARMVVGAVEYVRDLDADGMEAFREGIAALMRSTVSNNVRAGLPEDDHGDGRLAIHVAGVAHVLDRIDHVGRHRRVARPCRCAVPTISGL